MFTTNLIEVNQSEIKLYDVDAEAMKQILEYLYTAEINITNDNVQNVFTAASLFEIIDICDLCSTYMSQELCVANCVAVFQFASFHNCSTLKKTSRAYVVNHFNEVAEQLDILTLSSEDLSELVMDDNLNIDQEERVYECLIRWIEQDLESRAKLFVKLFKLIRVALMSDEYINDKLLTHELVASSTFCRSILNVVRLYKATDDKEGGLSILEEMDTSATPRLGMYNREMMVFVGGSQDQNTRALTCYDPKTKKNYYAIPLHVSFDFKFRIDYHRAVVNDKGSIFLVGGIFYEDHHFEETGPALGEVLMFDDYRKTWIKCASLQTPRCAHTVAHLNGFLYAIGGRATYPNGQALSSVECYDCTQDEWHYISPLPRGLCHHGSIVHNGKIYVVGGMTSPNNITNVFLEYDPQLDTWTQLERSMHTPRAEFGIAVLNNSLYVICGCNAERKLSTVEVYDFKTNNWKFGEDFPEERKSMATVVYDGSIYVCGGVRTLISRMNRAPRVVETKDLWKLDPRQRIPIWSRDVKLVQYANVHACVVTEINTKRVHESEFISR